MQDIEQAFDGVEVLPSRRRFLQLGLGALAGLAAGGATLLTPAQAEAEALRRSEILLANYGGGARTLAFKHTHTGEELAVTYWRGGMYDSTGLEEINYILRDFRTGDTVNINRSLLNTLVAIRKDMGVSAPLHVISGYRSPKTNEMLRRASEGVARQSYHTKGMAIDIRVPGYSTSGIARAARRMATGGVGYYDSSDFVHVDAGPVRTW